MFILKRGKQLWQHESKTVAGKVSLDALFTVLNTQLKKVFAQTSEKKWLFRRFSEPISSQNWLLDFQKSVFTTIVQTFLGKVPAERFETFKETFLNSKSSPAHVEIKLIVSVKQTRVSVF